MTATGPWRGDAMRGVQERAAVIYLAAWDRELSIRALTQERDALNARIRAEFAEQTSDLLLVAELRFGNDEMREVVKASRVGADVRLSGQRLPLPDAGEFWAWDPKRPGYGGQKPESPRQQVESHE